MSLTDYVDEVFITFMPSLLRRVSSRQVHTGYLLLDLALLTCLIGVAVVLYLDTPRAQRPQAERTEQHSPSTAP
jgi:hypothetical protein